MLWRVSSVAQNSVEAITHRLTVAEGLLSSLGTPRGLEAACKLLEADGLDEGAARDELTALIEDLRGGLRIFKPEMHPRGRGGKFRKSALIAVDVQKDFLPGGALGVAHGDEVVKPLLEAAKHVDVVVASGDQHPADHVSFVAQGGQWPPHAVRGTPGAEIHPKIKAAADIIVDKGTKRGVDAYSAFDGTGLAEKLRARGVGKVVVGGLATDYCVKATALDAIKEGFDVEVLPEASRAVNLNMGDGERAIEDMRKAGARIVHNVKEADSSADYPMAAAEPSEKAKRRRRRRPKGAKMEEATVVGGEATPWGGANPGAEAVVMQDQADSGEQVGSPTAPPNLREAEGWAACGNCVFFNKGQCNLYGQNNDAEPDTVYRGGWPVDHRDLCDSHLTLTPEDQQQFATTQRYVDRYLREGRQLADAVAGGDNDTAVRLRARLDVTARKLDEAGLAEPLEELGIHLHLPGRFDELKHPRSRGKFASKGGITSQHQSEPGFAAPGFPGSPHRTDADLAARPQPPKPGGSHKNERRRDLERRLAATERVNPNARVRSSAAERGRAQDDSTRRKLGMAEGADVLREARLVEEVKSDAYPGLDRSPKQNWVDKAGGLPRYIERIAKHLHYEKGKDIGNAIAIAVNVVKKMCASGDTNFPGKQNVKASSRAEACKAVAQWEAKKARSKGKSVSENWLAESFAVALELVEETYRPIPPSWNYVESVLGEVAALDGPEWFVGLSELDEAAEVVDEVGLERVVADELVEANVLRRLGLHFDAARHPRGRGGRFRDVLANLERDAQPKGRTFRSDGGTADGRGTPRTVEQHFAEDAGGQEHIFPSELFTKGARRGRVITGQRSPGAAVGGADALQVDLAIGGVLKAFPNVKDWDLSAPTDIGGTKHWKVTVTLGDGGTHKIDVDENGHVIDLTFALGLGEKPKAAASDVPVAKPAAVPQAPKTVMSSEAAGKTPTSMLKPTGDSNVISHMQAGTIFKGKDNHFYKHHGDTWMQGKKGPLKAAHIENLDTGTHKSVPYFTVHGVDYPIYAAEGSFAPKGAGAASSADNVFETLLASVKDQHGSLTSVSGKNVVITGKLPNHTRNEAEALIKAAGGTPQSSVSSSTHVLVTGEKVGATKINAAKKKGVAVIPWDEFKGLVESLVEPNVLKLAVVRAKLEECEDSTEFVRLRARERVLAGRVGPDRAGLLVEAVEILELQERKFSRAKRKQLAAKGMALPDGSYPIETKEDLHNAEVLANSGHGNVAAAKRHIRKRAAALGVKAKVAA